MPIKNPPHPGDFIRTEIIEPAGLSVTAAAAALQVSRPALSSLLNGKADLSGRNGATDREGVRREDGHAHADAVPTISLRRGSAKKKFGCGGFPSLLTHSLPCLALYAKNEIMKPSKSLAAHRDELRQIISRYNVAHPRVYGSVLTGNDDDESDLDLLVDATERTTLFTLAGLEHEAQQLLGVQVSVLTPQDLPTKFRNKVLQAAQPL